MDERTAKRMLAAAEHARRLANEAAERVGRMEAKAERARLDYEAAEAGCDRARLELSEAEQRAAEAERAPADAGLLPAGPAAEARAGVAAVEGVA